MPLSIPAMNHPTNFSQYPISSVEILHRFGLDLTKVETLSGCLEEEKEYAKHLEEQGVLEQLDDLSAIVEKCNAKGFVSPHRSRLLSRSRDSIESDNRSHIHFKADAANNRTRETPESSLWAKRQRFYNEREEKKEKSVGEKRQEKSVGEKRPVSGNLMRSSSGRAIHILSERMRRIQMNQQFERMRSLLPNPSVKLDKASIVEHTIDYIQSLQRRLAICSKKGNITGASASSVKSKSLSSVLQTNQPLSSDFGRSNDTLSLCGKSRYENLTWNNNGKDIFITINTVKKPNTLPSIILVLESHNIEIMDAFVSIIDTEAFHCLRAKAAEILDPVAQEKVHRALSKLIKSEFQIRLDPQIW